MKSGPIALGALLVVSCAQGGGSEPWQDESGSGGSGLGGAAGGGAGAGGRSVTGGAQGSGGGAVDAGGSGGQGGSSTGCGSAPVSAKAASVLASSEYQRWKTAHVADCPATASAVVVNADTATSGNWVVSEGIGYGMLLAVGNDDRVLFDKLWKFYGDHLDNQGLMNWSLNKCDSPGNNQANAATDADLDAAMALVQADAKWGGYKSQAIGLLGKIKQYETDTCSNGLLVLRPGDRFGGCSDPGNPGKLNPSYFSPAYYRVFALVDTANAAAWRKLADDTYVLLAQYQAAKGGLVSEWGYADGRAEGDYGYNACRTPWRIATDYLWFCTPAAKTFLDAMSQYIDSHGGLTGVSFDKNSAFIGGLALSGISGGQAKLDTYVNAWLTVPMFDTPYFQGTLRLLYLHVAAGEFSSTVPP